jgi:hypothetical protein
MWFINRYGKDNTRRVYATELALHLRESSRVPSTVN